MLLGTVRCSSDRLLGSVRCASDRLLLLRMGLAAKKPAKATANTPSTATTSDDGITYYTIAEDKGGKFMELGQWRVLKKRERGHIFFQVLDPEGFAMVMVLASSFPGIDEESFNRILAYLLRQAHGGADKDTLYQLRDALNARFSDGTFADLLECDDF